jgi:hypothetical protein
MSKFKLFLFTGIGFGFEWAINIKTGINLDDPSFYVTPIFNALNNATSNSSFDTYLTSYWQSQLPYLLLIIKVTPIIPLIAAFITNDVKGNSIAYVAGMVIGFLITYLLI